METNSLNKELLQRGRRIISEQVMIPTRPAAGQFKGRGIVTCAGGHRYFTNAWILIRMLRYLGCDLPIQLWHLGPNEVSDQMKRFVSKYGVECIDGSALMPKKSFLENESKIAGWILKSLAITRCSFEELIYLDADNLPVRDPSFLFDAPEYKRNGALFWPDIRIISNKDPLWKIFELPYVDEPQVETGQLVVNKRSCWHPLLFTEQLNLNADLFYSFAYGGKDLFRFAWRKSGQNFGMPSSTPQVLTIPDWVGEATDAVLCQHDFLGERLFQHRMFCKWDLFEDNPWVSGFFFECQCHEFLDELKRRWNGRCCQNSRIRKSAVLRASEKALANKIWVLEFPKMLLEKHIGSQSSRRNEILDQPLPDFVKAPENVGRIKIAKSQAWKDPSDHKSADDRVAIRKELKFISNGSLNIGSNEQIGCFWDLGVQGGKVQLHLSAGKGKIITLKQVNQDLWKGRCVHGPAVGRNVKLRSVQDLYPGIANGTKRMLAQEDSHPILKSLGKKVHVKCSSESIADHISATYACAGLCRLGASVTFHTPHAGWLGRVAEPGLTIKAEPLRSPHDPWKAPKSWREVNQRFDDQLRYGKSRISWYAGSLHPMLQPAKPAVNLNEITHRFPFENYIVFAPFTLTKFRDRCWPDTHWTRLAWLIREAGYEIVAVGKEEQAPLLLRTFSQTQAYWVVGQSNQWLTDALLGAAAYVGVDFDITHLAALLEVKSIAIHSQMPGSFLWPNSTVQSVTPDTGCTMCRWQTDRGFVASCYSGCSALATISPETVAKAVFSALR